MKKIKRLSLFLCLVLLLQCVTLPVMATEPVQTETIPVTEPQIQEIEEIPFGSVCVAKGCRTIEGMVPVGGYERRLDTAQSAFLYEITTDTVVYSYNADLKVHPGTLTKMVLALLVLENCELDEIVTVTEGIQSYIPASSNNIKLKSLEQISVKELLYAVMLYGANDAAVALAHHVTGTTSTDAFLTMMNNRVKMMGCTNTEFGNISGLYTAQSYSTARDMAKIVREAIQNKDFAEIFATVEYTIPATDVSKERELAPQNYMMSELIIPDFYDTRVTGGMQSYHEQTGASIVCTAKERTDEYPLNYIGVVLGATRTFAENGWQPINYGNFNELTALFKYGFENFKINRIVYEGMSLTQFAVSGGESNAVGQAIVDIDSVVPINAQMQNLVMRFSVADGGLAAPVKKDQLIATVQVEYRNSVLAEAEVYAMGNVKQANETGVTIRSTAVRSDSDASGFLRVLGIICVSVLGLAVAYLSFNAYMRSRMRARHRRRRENRRRNRG